MIRRGYNVTFLSNRNWKHLIESSGATFHAIAEEDPPQNERNNYRFFLTNTLPSFSRSFSFVEQKLRSTERCILLYRLNMLGMECAAERFCLPNIKVALQPSVIRSIERPSWPLTSMVQGPLKAAAKSFLMPLLYTWGDMATPYRRHNNNFRKSIGVSPQRAGKLMQRREDMFLVMCPEWFAMPQKDWPHTSRCLGFPFYDTDFYDAEIEEFISRHGPPIVFTPGTGNTDVQDFFRTAGGICEKLQHSGIFLSPAISKAAQPSSNRLVVKDFAELSWLLPRAKMLVHHGGIGSVAQAMRAGIPQVVIPDRFDQPDNALRMAVLGLGGAYFGKARTVDGISTLIEAVLKSPHVRDQVREASRLLGGRDACELAFEAITSLLECSQPLRKERHERRLYS
jgi:UDP:flavonoid glycosyltransferase YjiC (YdhE family)